MNRFRQQKNNPSVHEKLVDSVCDWVVSSEPRKGWINSYMYMNLFSVCQRHLWDDSNRKRINSVG